MLSILVCHSYFLRLDQKQLERGKPYPPLATLLEANWLITRGNNLKITQEFLNPNRAVPNGERTRWSLVYELTPIQFVQIRAGVRYYDGIPQDNSEHQRQYFAELHGFF